MLHPRTKRSKLVTLIDVLEAMARLERVADAGGHAVARRGDACLRPRYTALAALLREGMSKGQFALTRSQYRDMLVALDLYNTHYSDGGDHPWDPEVETLFQEFGKQFTKTYGEPVYAEGRD